MGGPAMWLLNKVCPCFWSSSDGHIFHHTQSCFHLLSSLKCPTNLSGGSCQSLGVQWCEYRAACKWPVCVSRTTWVPVSLLGISTAHSCRLGPPGSSGYEQDTSWHGHGRVPCYQQSVQSRLLLGDNGLVETQQESDNSQQWDYSISCAGPL